MKAHGAYSVAKSTLNDCKRGAADTRNNIAALMSAGPLDEDSNLIAKLIDIRDRAKKAQQILSDLSIESLKLAQTYLKGKKTVKEFELRSKMIG